MESATIAPTGSAAESSTNSKTCADLMPLAAERHGDLAAVTYKDDSGKWVSKTYREVGEIVRQLALGLIELGIEKGDKVSILANTRPEWTYFDFAALSVGATVVPIYQTNSPEECQYVHRELRRQGGDRRGRRAARQDRRDPRPSARSSNR